MLLTGWVRSASTCLETRGRRLGLDVVHDQPWRRVGSRRGSRRVGRNARTTVASTMWTTTREPRIGTPLFNARQVRGVVVSFRVCKCLRASPFTTRHTLPRTPRCARLRLWAAVAKQRSVFCNTTIGRGMRKGSCIGSRGAVARHVCEYSGWKSANAVRGRALNRCPRHTGGGALHPSRKLCRVCLCTDPRASCVIVSSVHLVVPHWRWMLLRSGGCDGRSHKSALQQARCLNVHTLMR